MMYAVVETGGKQYKVQPGDIIEVEKLTSDVGASLTLDKVLFASAQTENTESKVWLGKPYLDGANVECEVLAQGRGEKLLLIKFKRRKQYRRTQGHRQEHTHLLIKKVTVVGASEAAEATAVKETKANYVTPLRPKFGLRAAKKAAAAKTKTA